MTTRPITPDEALDFDDIDALAPDAEYSYPSPLGRVSRDLKQAAATLSLLEVRYLVDLYYEAQRYRIASANQVRSLARSEPVPEPESLLTWATHSFDIVEGEIKKGLDVFSRREPSGLGEWLRSITGIGPVIAAGLLAHVQPGEKSTVGQIWRHAGLDPTSKWESGEKRPWNASLKTLCYKVGESFVKVQNRPTDVYGQKYAARKAVEIARNDQGLFAGQAEAILKARRIGKTTDAYKAYSQGRLPPAHLHARARRYAVKLFLSHYYEAGYFIAHRKLPEVPYVVSHLGHTDLIPAPHADLIPGLGEAQRARQEEIARGRRAP